MMLLFSLAFLLGDVYLQSFSHLPSHFLIIAGLSSSVLCWMLFRRFRRAYLLLAFALGFSYSSWYAESILAWTLPYEWEGVPLNATGKVISLPVEENGLVSFLFQLKKIQLSVMPVKAGMTGAADSIIRLSWKTNKPISSGDEYQLMVRLKRVHGTQNPGGFDVEAWALQKGVRATGSVLPDSHGNHFIRHQGEWINSFRQSMRNKILLTLPKTSTAPWLLALIVGERSQVRQEDWQVLRNTGTNHLMAIGGLHIGMIAGFFYMIITWCWRRIPLLMQFLPARQAGACAGLIVGVFYAALSGFAIPAQRACIMLVIFTFANLMRRSVGAWHVWSFAVLITLLFNPLVILDNSFWLSFGTIALIIYGMDARLAPEGWWWKWARVQWVIGLGLIPLSLLFFQQTSLVSFIANSIAIPWLGCLILPFCFLSCLSVHFFPAVTGWLLFFADKSLSGLWMILLWFSQQPFFVWMHAMPSYWIALLTTVSFIMFLFPAGMRGRWLGIVWLLPLICYQPDKPKQGEVWMSLLDVGQGLSIVVQTANHLMIYDAGPALGKMDAGEQIVLPYLRSIGANQLDMLVISHGDNDHRGGANAILAEMPAKLIKTSVTDKIPSLFTSDCLAGNKWEWDGVDFEFLSPFSDTLGLGNNSSCILRISAHQHAILLTGDMEKETESVLLQRKSDLLNANILVAPHHGSKTSSSAEFVKVVNPRYVLYATGYRNRYHFPHAIVINEYRALNAKQLNTVDTGTIQLKMGKGEIQINKYRLKNKRYWWD